MLRTSDAEYTKLYLNTWHVDVKVTWDENTCKIIHKSVINHNDINYPYDNKYSI